MKMNSKQKRELRELLEDHSETLVAVYDEGINYGMRKGCVVGVFGSVIGMVLAYGVIKIVSHRKKNEEES